MPRPVLTRRGAPPTPPPPTVQGRGLAMLRYAPDTWTTADTASIHTLFIDAGHYSELATIKALNPEIRLLGYALAFQSTTSTLTGVPGAGSNSLVNTQSAQAHDTSFPSDPWQLKNSSGTVIVSGGRTLLDVSKASYQAQCLINARAIMTTYPLLDGMFWDNVNASYTQLSGNVLAVRGGVTYTEAQWETDTIAWMAAVATPLRTDGQYLCANAGKGGTTFEAGYAGYWVRLAPYLDGVNLEWYVESPVQTPFAGDLPYPEYNVDSTRWTGHWDSWYLAPKHAQDSGMHAYCGHWGSATVSGGSVANDQQKMMYGKASFLLTWDASEGGFWWDDRVTGAASNLNVRWTTDLGTPIDAAVLAPNVGVGYMRKFTGGVAIVNPHKTSTQAFTLGDTYTSVHDGNPYSSVTLNPTTGLILTLP